MPTVSRDHAVQCFDHELVQVVCSKGSAYTDSNSAAVVADRLETVYEWFAYVLVGLLKSRLNMDFGNSLLDIESALGTAAEAGVQLVRTFEAVLGIDTDSDFGIGRFDRNNDVVIVTDVVDDVFGFHAMGDATVRSCIVETDCLFAEGRQLKLRTDSSME